MCLKVLHICKMHFIMVHIIKTVSNLLPESKVGCTYKPGMLFIEAQPLKPNPAVEERLSCSQQIWEKKQQFLATNEFLSIAHYQVIEMQSSFNMDNQVLGKDLSSTSAHDSAGVGRKCDCEACLYI